MNELSNERPLTRRELRERERQQQSQKPQVEPPEAIPSPGEPPSAGQDALPEPTRLPLPPLPPPQPAVESPTLTAPLLAPQQSAAPVAPPPASPPSSTQAPTPHVPLPDNPGDFLRFEQFLATMSRSGRRKWRTESSSCLDYLRHLHSKVVLYESSFDPQQAFAAERAELHALLNKERTQAHESINYLMTAAQAAIAAKQQVEAAYRQLHSQYTQERDATTARLAALTAENQRLKEALETEETLQDAGYYDYTLSAESSIQYKARLDAIKDICRQMNKDGTAVVGGEGFTFNNSREQGEKFAKEFRTLMLNAFNQEVENALTRMERMRTKQVAINRINKSAEKVAKNGQMMRVRISDAYLKLRLEEVEIAFAWKRVLEEEKAREAERRAEAREREREDRERKARIKELERQRAEAKREKERIEAEIRDRFEKERARLGEIQGQLSMRDEMDDDTRRVLEELEARLAEIDDAKERAEEELLNPNLGHVYVISNIGSFGERVVKIGMTRRADPRDRVKELGDASVPFGFDVHAIFYAPNAREVEAALHNEFRDRAVNKVNPRKEFFNVTPREVREAMERLFPGTLLEFNEEPEAAEYRQSLKM